MGQRAGMRSKSWSAAHKPPTAAVQTSTAGVSGGCRMRKAFITTPTPTKVGANVYWAQVGQGLQYLVTMIKQTNLLHMTLCWFLYFGNNFSHILKLRLFLILKYELGPLSECPT